MNDAAASEALVVATYSRRMRLQLPNQQYLQARVKGKRLRPVCGDRVLARPLQNETDWLIESILPRANALARSDSRGRREILAANLTRLVVVLAPTPQPDWFVADRYLCAAELMNVTPLLVFNKMDLTDLIPAELENYERIGYTTIRCSAKQRTELTPLADLLVGQIAILVGQSGVGKSSILNALATDAQQRTASLSDSTGEGRHTTVNSEMIPLQNGGAVIDSPGVRDYMPAITDPTTVTSGFREILQLAGACRFANCHHLREPDCAVKTAIAEGKISERRYESFRRLRRIAGQFKDQRY